MANHPDFTELRRQIDHAITFHDLRAARAYADTGLRLAQTREVIGEQLYFRAQHEIIDGHFEKAIPYLDKALEYNPHDGAAYNDRALCMVELGMIDGVMDYFDRGIAVEPDYATIYHNKAWFLNKLGHHREALTLFKKALTLEPGRAVTYENMANTYENLGYIPDAINAYTQALTCIEPTATDIRKQLTEEIRRLKRH